MIYLYERYIYILEVKLLLTCDFNYFYFSKKFCIRTRLCPLFSSFAHFLCFLNEKYHITLYEISTITLPSEWPFSTFSCASFNLFNGYGHVGSIRGGDKRFS